MVELTLIEKTKIQVKAETTEEAKQALKNGAPYYPILNSKVIEFAED